MNGRYVNVENQSYPHVRLAVLHTRYIIMREKANKPMRVRVSTAKMVEKEKKQFTHNASFDDVVRHAIEFWKRYRKVVE